MAQNGCDLLIALPTSALLELLLLSGVRSPDCDATARHRLQFITTGFLGKFGKESKNVGDLENAFCTDGWFIFSKKSQKINTN
jgi:hypothetical protein